MMAKYHRIFNPTSILLACIFCVLLMRLWLVSYHEIHWDEFLVLDWVYQMDRGDAVNPFNWLFVSLLQWLTRVSGFEVQQIHLARFAFVPLAVVSQIFIFLFVRRFVSQPAALFAVLCFISFSFVFLHAFTLRLDVLLVFFLTGALWLSYREQNTLWSDIAAGILLGLAGLVSIKAVFYLPIFMAILFCRARDGNWQPNQLARVSVMPLTALGVFLLVLFWAIDQAPSHSTLNFINFAVSGSLFAGSFFPGRGVFLFSVATNPLYWVIFSLGLLFIFRSSWGMDGVVKEGKLVVISLFSPLLTLFFYQHSHPYFYIFMLAPVSVFLAFGYEELKRHKFERLIMVIAISLTLMSATQVWHQADKSNDRQQQVLEIIHQLFPEPVPYIDRSSMVASFPKTGLFMSSWYLGEYHKKGTPIFEAVLRKDRPRFVLANVNSLDLDHLSDATSWRRLMPADEDVLQKNFVHFWGPIYMLGKKVVIEDPDQTELFMIYAPGNYYVKAGEGAMIDGELLREGNLIALAVGEHRLSANQQMEVILHFGVPPQQPDVAYDFLPLFGGE